MILLRSLSEEKFALSIKDGMVSCRDMLTTLQNERITNYKSSNYNEIFIKQVLEGLMCEGGYQFFDENSKELKLLFDDFIPYIYVTYFHVLNENSLKWLEEECDDSSSFIFVEPKLDLRTNKIIGPNYTGDKIKYIDDYSSIDFNAIEKADYAVLSIFEPFPSGADDIVRKMCYYMNKLVTSMFYRQVDNQFGKGENEFRIVSWCPMRMNINGQLSYLKERKFNLIMDGCHKYEGYIAQTQQYPIRMKSLFVNTNDILMKKLPQPVRIDSLKYDNVEVESNFFDIDIRPIARDYGFIGGKEECRKFIQNNMKRAKKNNFDSYIKTKIIKRDSKHTFFDVKTGKEIKAEDVKPGQTVLYYD